MKNYIVLLLVLLCSATVAFRPTSQQNSHHLSRNFSLLASQKTEPVLTPPEKTVVDVLKLLHESKFPFRAVVVGNGAILESTMVLGPTMKVSSSPATGANILTLASEDKAFEFHIQTAQVSKIVFTQKESPQKPGRIMSISRLLNAEGKPMCSLILADDSSSASEWYEGLIQKYGGEIQL